MAGLRLRWGPGGGMLKSIPAKGQGTELPKVMVGIWDGQGEG